MSGRQKRSEKQRSGGDTAKALPGVVSDASPSHQLKGLQEWDRTAVLGHLHVPVTPCPVLDIHQKQVSGKGVITGNDHFLCKPLLSLTMCGLGRVYSTWGLWVLGDPPWMFHP